MDTGDRIRQHRKAKGWTQTRLATEIGVSMPAISALEIKGTTSLTTFRALTEALGCSADDLLGTGKSQFVVSWDGSQQVTQDDYLPTRETLVVTSTTTVGEISEAILTKYRKYWPCQVVITMAKKIEPPEENNNTI